MAFKNILPLHKKDEAEQSAHHQHEHRKRANGHINQKEHKKRKQNRGFTSKWRNEMVAMTAEFAGTFLFLFFAFGGTQVANTAARYSDASTAGQQGNSITQTPNTSVLLYISLIFGFSLMVNVWVFFRVSGGLFNPAVSPRMERAKQYTLLSDAHHAKHGSRSRLVSTSSALSPRLAPFFVSFRRCLLACLLPLLSPQCSRVT